MGTSNPRPRGAPSVSGELQKARADREQTRRLLSRTPKPAAKAGTAPVGVAQVMSQDGTMAPNGTGLLNWDAVRYNTPTDPFDTGVALDWIGFEDANPSRITLEVGGWYSALVEFNFTWATPSDAPAYFNPVIYFGGAGHDWDKRFVPATTDQTGARGIADFLDIGPIYCQDQFTVLQAQLRYTPAASLAGYVYPRIVWKITRWS